MLRKHSTTMDEHDMDGAGHGRASKSLEDPISRMFGEKGLLVDADHARLPTALLIDKAKELINTYSIRYTPVSQGLSTWWGITMIRDGGMKSHGMMKCPEHVIPWTCGVVA